ncbi:hypothetical protein [Klebsiella pneumoniae]
MSACWTPVSSALFVAPGATRQGIGRALLDEIKQHYAG